MRYIGLIILITALFFTDCKSKMSLTNNQPVIEEQTAERDPKLKYYDQATWVLGYFNLNRLYQPPYSEWYFSGFDNYQPEQEYIDRLRNLNMSDLTIKIVLGTWCPDSRREVPRFMRIIDLIDFPADKIEFIGVDNVKISPIENYDVLKIERVPTFIFYLNKVETGRIIETPKTSLEQDILNILLRNEK